MVKKTYTKSAKKNTRSNAKVNQPPTVSTPAKVQVYGYEKSISMLFRSILSKYKANKINITI
jgi:hypothetical protein